MKKYFLLFSVLLFQLAFSQSDFLKDGNLLLSQKKYTDAEVIFRKGLAQNPKELSLKNQLAFSLIYQKKYAEAEKLINEVLQVEPKNKAALWYGGMNNLNNKGGSARKAVNYFEKSKSLLEKDSPKKSITDYFIGKSYKNLLFTEGLTQSEIDKMVTSFQSFVTTQPKAEDKAEVVDFLAFVKRSKPKKSAQKWIIVTEDKGAEKQVNQFFNDAKNK